MQVFGFLLYNNSRKTVDNNQKTKLLNVYITPDLPKNKEIINSIYFNFKYLTYGQPKLLTPRA